MTNIAEIGVTVTVDGIAIATSQQSKRQPMSREQFVQGLKDFDPEGFEIINYMNDFLSECLQEAGHPFNAGTLLDRMYDEEGELVGAIE